MAIREIKKYEKFSGAIEALAIYIPEDNIVISSSGISGFSVYNGTDYMSGYNGDVYRATINSLDRPCFLPMENREKNSFLHYAVPLENSFQASNGVAIFMIKNSTLSSALINIISKYEGVGIIAADSQILHAIDHTGRKPDASYVDALIYNNIAQKSYQADFGGTNHSIVQTVNSNSELHYIISAPRNQFTDAIILEQIPTVMIFISALIFGTLVLILLTKKQYQPFIRLINHIKKTSASNTHLKNINDIVDIMIDLSEDMLRKLNRQKDAVKNQIILKLLLDSLSDAQEIQSFNQQQLKLEGTAFFSLYLYMSLKQNMNTREYKMEALYEWIFEGGVGYGTPLMDDNLFGFVVCRTDETVDDPTFVHMALESLEVILDKLCRGNYTVGVGSICHELTGINVSFTEATTAVEYRLIFSDKKFIQFKDVMEAQDNSTWYSLVSIVELSQSLKRGEYNVACKAAGSIISSIKNKSSIIEVRSMCTEITSSIIKVVCSMNMDYNGYISLFNYNSVSDFEEKLLLAIKDICDLVQSKLSGSRSDVLFMDIQQYIQTNLTSYDLSLESTANAFGISTSYVGKLIKNKQGITFTEYVTELRFIMIKDELRNTEKPLIDIISHMGYVDISSFIRKFKRIERMTPGEYRRQNRMNNP